MIKKLTQMGILFFIASTFLFCIDEEQKNPQPDLSDARARIRPIADAGKDVTVTLPTNVSKLDGSNSKDSLGLIKSYLWSKISGPSSHTFANPSNAVTDVVNLISGTYTFRLTVTNDKNAKAYDDVVINVKENTILASTALSSTGELYFSGNMDNVTITKGSKGPVFNGWDQLQNHEYVKYISLNGGDSYANQEIVKDPINLSRNVLYSTVVDDDPAISGTTRAQTTIRFNDGVNLPVYHTSHRMLINPDIEYLKNYSSSVRWFTLFETWSRRVAEWDGNVAGSARWNIGINKVKGIGQPLYWRLDAQYMQPAAIEQNFIWTHTNNAVPIPFGKWFTLDIYMKRGEGSNGRMTVKMTIDGGPTTTLFDVVNSTIYPGHPEVEIRKWEVFKLYTGDSTLDWMRANGKKLSVHYNDFKWYKN